MLTGDATGPRGQTQSPCFNYYIERKKCLENEKWQDNFAPEGTERSREGYKPFDSENNNRSLNRTGREGRVMRPRIQRAERAYTANGADGAQGDDLSGRLTTVKNVVSVANSVVTVVASVLIAVISPVRIIIVKADMPTAKEAITARAVSVRIMEGIVVKADMVTVKEVITVRAASV